MIMYSRKLISIVAIVTIIFENVDANWTTLDCFDQLVNDGFFEEHHTKFDAFIHAFNTLEILFGYLDHLYNAASSIIRFVVSKKKSLLQDPVDWCLKNIYLYRVIGKNCNVLADCQKEMRISGYNTLTYGYFIYIRDAVGKLFKYTDARGPSDFCNNNESPADQIPIDQNGHFIFDLNQQPAPTQPPLENPNFYSNQPSGSTSNVGKRKKLTIDLNKSPPEEDE